MILFESNLDLCQLIVFFRLSLSLNHSLPPSLRCSKLIGLTNLDEKDLIGMSLLDFQETKLVNFPICGMIPNSQMQLEHCMWS